MMLLQASAVLLQLRVSADQAARVLNQGETLDDITVLNIIGGSDYFCVVRASIDTSLPSENEIGVETTWKDVDQDNEF